MTFAGDDVSLLEAVVEAEVDAVAEEVELGLGFCRLLFLTGESKVRLPSLVVLLPLDVDVVDGFVDCNEVEEPEKEE